jgi:trk system potassium uptake protein TrkH
LQPEAQTTMPRATPKLLLARHLSPERLFILSFVVIILLGGLLLWLPVSAAGRPLSFLDALFSSASAVCVTGLTVITIGKDLSVFGQVVTLVLFKIGGLGIITFSAVFFVMMGRGLATKERDILQTVFLHAPRRDLAGILKFILLSSLSFEAVGTFILWLRLSLDFPPGRALYLALYHAVSAFNNCGYSLFADSLTAYQGDIVVNLTVMALIVAGGIGFIALFELSMRLKGRQQRLSVHTKIVLIATALLIFAGAGLFLLLENARILSGLPWLNRVLASLFQSVTARTAGFNTIDIANLGNETLLMTMMLMFIGASPGSTGGGIKTTSASLLFLLVWNRFRGREEVTVFNRTIPKELLNRMISIILAASIVLVLGTSVMMLSAGTTAPPDESRYLFVEYLFEAFSAFGTVGLSMNLTPTLSPVQKGAVMLLMIAGRVGPLTLAFSLARSSGKKQLIYAEEGVMVG